MGLNFLPKIAIMREIQSGGLLMEFILYLAATYGVIKLWFIAFDILKIPNPICELFGGFINGK